MNENEEKIVRIFCDWLYSNSYYIGHRERLSGINRPYQQLVSDFKEFMAMHPELVKWLKLEDWMEDVK